MFNVVICDLPFFYSNTVSQLERVLQLQHMRIFEYGTNRG